MTETREDEVALNRTGRVGRTAKRKAPTAPVPPRIPRITRLMALAIKFQDMIDRGEVRDYAELARLGFVTRARVTQVMNLLLLAPDIQEALLHSTQEISITERHIRSGVREVDWKTQRAILAAMVSPAPRM